VKLPSLPILSDLDGTLIDSKASVIAAFQWWVESRGLPGDTAARIPFGRTSTDAASVLAPHLDCVAEGAFLDEWQERNTQ
jgi:phosphoglycolate phosphatase-like HAD superfamily hydrolase